MVLFHHMYAHIPEPRCQCRAQHLAMCPRRHQRTPWKIESPITTRAVGRGSAAAPSTSAVNAKHDMICAVHSQKGIACCTVSVMQRGGDFAKLCAVVLLMLRLTKCLSRLTECLLTCNIPVAGMTALPRRQSHHNPAAENPGSPFSAGRHPNAVRKSRKQSPETRPPCQSA